MMKLRALLFIKTTLKRYIHYIIEYVFGWSVTRYLHACSTQQTTETTNIQDKNKDNCRK